MNDVPFTDQRTFSDDEFFDQLRIPGARGRELARARKRGDRTAAGAAVAAHFRERATPRWFSYSHGTPWHDTETVGGVLPRAEGLLRGQLRSHWPPHDIVEPLRGTTDIDWVKALELAPTSASRGTFVGELSTAFALTGEPRFARRMLELMRESVVAMPFVLDPRFFDDHDAFFGGPANGTLGVIYRAFRWIDVLHSGAVHAPGVFADEDVVWIVKQLCFWSAQYYRLCADGMREGNHHLIDHGHAPYVFGTMFPEFVFGRAMARRGATVTRWHCGRHLLPDGSYEAHSAEYQYHIFYHYLHPLGIAQANGQQLFSKRQLKGLQEWAEFQAYVVKPDGWLPPVGDSAGRRLAHFFGHLAGPVMTPRLERMARSLGFAVGSVPAIAPAEVARVMSAWKPGQPVRATLSSHFDHTRAAVRSSAKALAALPSPSRRYDDGGWTFMRSAWSPDADHLVVSHYGSGEHVHWDMMSFILHTQGRTLIGDPATWIYFTKYFGHGAALPDTKGLPPLHRGYSYAVDSHNCQVMNEDRLKPLAAMCHDCFWGGNPPQHGVGLAAFGGPIEVSEMWHDAYAPWRHRRFVVHLRDIGFVHLDIWKRTDGKLSMAPMQWTQSLHCEWDVEIDAAEPAQGAAVRLALDDAQCLVVPGAESDVRWKTSRDPYLRGIYATNRKMDGPEPWVLELQRRIRGPAVFATAYLTRPTPTLRSAPTPRYLGHEASAWYGWQHEGVSANEIDLGEHGTLLIASCPFGKPLESPELSTDAELAVVVRGRDRRIRSWALARGSRLAVGKQALYRGRKKEWHHG